MKANKTHISLETAKLLRDCGVVASQCYIKYFQKDGTETIWDVLPPRILPEEYNSSIYYPAFTWQEILWEHSKKFFGDIMVSYGEDSFEMYSREILSLLQQQKYDEADLYFRKNCILINKK